MDGKSPYNRRSQVQAEGGSHTANVRFAAPLAAKITKGLIYIAVGTLLSVWLRTPSYAQYAAPNAPITSLSGQFVTRDNRLRGASPVALKYSADNQFVCLDPALVSVSCERIKSHLVERFQTKSTWRGKVFLVIQPAQSSDDPVGLVAERFRDVWQYRLDLPDVTDRARYVRAIVQVLLLEMANRKNPPRSAELPLWLVEGFTRHLLASSELEIVLQPPTRKANGLPIHDTFYESRRPTTLLSQKDDPLTVARMVMQTNAYFGFEQLSWPTDTQLTSDQKDLFGCASQLFVAELLRMKDGKECILNFLDQLPNYYNWQLALISAFHNSFKRPLDVEKWWNLRWLDFTSTEASHRWLLAESWSRLEQALQAPVETRVDKDELPQASQAPLQALIGKWDENSNPETLKSKIYEFDLLRVQLDPRVVPLLDSYKSVVETFLKDSNPSGITALVRKKAAIEKARSHTVIQLELLDDRRRAAAAQPERVVVTESPSSDR